MVFPCIRSSVFVILYKWEILYMWFLCISNALIDDFLGSSVVEPGDVFWAVIVKIYLKHRSSQSRTHADYLYNVQSTRQCTISNTFPSCYHIFTLILPPQLPFILSLQLPFSVFYSPFILPPHLHKYMYYNDLHIYPS